MARYEEMHQQRLALRARSASAAPTPSPTQENRPLPVQSQPARVNISQNVIGGPPHGEYPLDYVSFFCLFVGFAWVFASAPRVSK
jgi:hypothetical protein